MTLWIVAAVGYLLALWLLLSYRRINTRLVALVRYWNDLADSAHDGAQSSSSLGTNEPIYEARYMARRDALERCAADLELRAALPTGRPRR